MNVATQLPDVMKVLSNALFLIGATKGRRTNAVPGQEALFRRVQMPHVQTQVDEWEQLG